MAETFIRDGYVNVEAAFPDAVAAQCRDLLWQQMPGTPDDPASWSSPVVRLGFQTAQPFVDAVNTPQLHEAFDALVGPRRWLPRNDVGTFAIRFPSDEPPGDDSWHLDASFPPADPAQVADPFAWRINLASRGRALLILMLFSDVDTADAPTRIRVGSHRRTTRILAPHGDEGLPMMELSTQAAADTDGLPEALATGRAGDVYLCHPFTVHAAQPHHGTGPRFLAQPPLHPRGGVSASFDVEKGTAPIEVAIREALDS